MYQNMFYNEGGRKLVILWRMFELANRKERCVADAPYILIVQVKALVDYHNRLKVEEIQISKRRM